ncbi:MAG TPA: hypothetical protein VGQ62_17425 [Chloroflexota bacterium]|jgi:hypothetical protein|nr:hypothetical protein [Chloroflexota bacterium]
MRISTNNTGLLLAVFAGCTSLVEAVWPGSAPQSETLNLWLPLAVLCGCGFLCAAWLADHHPFVSRILLLVGGLGLLASGLYFGAVVGGGSRSVVATLADFIPGVLALAAGFLIGPVERHVAP